MAEEETTNMIYGMTVAIRSGGRWKCILQGTKIIVEINWMKTFLQKEVDMKINLI